MKKRRIFIAINLPDKIKRRLAEIQQEWASLPVRWTKQNNMHITLAFIGYVTDEEMLEMCKKVREVGQKNQPFEIRLKRICFGPPNRSPRMIWAEGENNPDLAKLRNDLENSLFKNNNYKNQNISFHPHITLARIRIMEWKKMDSKPSIDKEISLSFPVNSIEVMESYLSSRGSDYTILESIELSA